MTRLTLLFVPAWTAFIILRMLTVGIDGGTVLLTLVLVCVIILLFFKASDYDD